MSESWDNNVVIIGAPRSGTNMLRDLLVSFQGIATWPCDEINYIWRHGNVRYPSDELPAELARPSVSNYIQNEFNAIRKHKKADIIVEKTCANSLRVPFVNTIFPKAKYIFIYRDGIDAASSASLRWKAKLDISYIIKKLRYVPIFDIPYYSFRYAWGRIYRLFSSENRLAFWGPGLENMNNILEKHNLKEVCAIQWQQCIERAENAFSDIPQQKVLRVCYEKFVKQPNSELLRILDFLGYRASEEDCNRAITSVSSASLGKGRRVLKSNEIVGLEVLIGDTLKRLGYGR